MALLDQDLCVHTGEFIVGLVKEVLVCYNYSDLKFVRFNLYFIMLRLHILEIVLHCVCYSCK